MYHDFVKKKKWYFLSMSYEEFFLSLLPSPRFIKTEPKCLISVFQQEWVFSEISILTDLLFSLFEYWIHFWEGSNMEH